MRIIAGKFKGRKLRSPLSLEVRPTSDRLRETLFNIISAQVERSSFLDLCAGSGAVAIEALSRGARHVTVVDRSRKMCQLITANLELCAVPTEQAQVVQAEAVDFVRRAIRDRPPPWDLVFFDPPYDSPYVDVIKVLSEAPHLFSKNAVVIVEHYHKKDLPDQLGTMIRKRVLKQGDSSLSFYYQDDTSSLFPAS